MQSVVNIVLPVFAIILSGYVAGFFKLLGEESGDVLQRFVFYVAMPVLLFYAMAKVEPSEMLNWSYLAAYLGGQVITFMLTMLVAKHLYKRRLAEVALCSMASIYGNTGYMGIPLILAAVGTDWAVPAIIATAVNAAIVVGVTAAIVEIDMSINDGFWGIFKNVSRALVINPLLIAPVFGFLWSLTGLGIADPIETFSKTLGAAAGPCALFSIGLFLVGKTFRRGYLEVNFIVFIKLVIHPMITWILAFHVLGLNDLWGIICVIMAALPTGANIFILARRYQLFLDSTSTIIIISTVVSVLTLSILFSYWSEYMVT